MTDIVYSEKQKEVLRNANARWNLFTGAVRSGKSFIANDLLVKRLKELPDGRRAIIGKTETTIMRNVLDPLQDRYGEKYVSDIQGKKREATIFGKKLYCIGANDSRATKKLQGSGFQYVLGDEITTWPEDFFNMLKSRLDKKNSMFDGTCNPSGPYPWLKQQIIDRKDELDVFHQHFTIDDNPFLSPVFVEQLKKEYSGVWYQRYIDGLWVLAEGLIYDMYDPDHHVVDILPEMKRKWVGIDYGTSNATAFVLIGLGEDDHIYILDEYKHSGDDLSSSKTDKDYSEDFINWLGDREARWINIDPSAKSFRLQLWRKRDEHPSLHNIRKANNDVLDGIRNVSSLLSAKKLYVHSKCKEIQKELTLYSWDSKAQEKGKDKPLEKHDHLMDALRYAVMGINTSIFDRLLQTA